MDISLSSLADMKRNLAIIILTFVVLLLVISLALHLHRQSKKEVLGQFNDRQLDVARQLAREIESHLRAYSVCLQMLASFPSLQYRDMRKVPSDIQTSFEFVKKLHAKSISLYDERQNIIYSAGRSTTGLNDTRRELYDWARKKDNKGKIFITSLPQTREGEKPVQNAVTASESLKPPSPQLLLAEPLYHEDVHAGCPKPVQKFAGLLLLTVDMEELLAEHLVFIGPKEPSTKALHFTSRCRGNSSTIRYRQNSEICFI